MKKQTVILGIVALLAIVAYLGPRPKPIVAFPPHDVALPEDLDAYLEKKEASVHALRPALAARIQWESPTKEQTPVSLVYLHSFTGSNRELTPVIENVGKATHSNIFFTRFRGHGQDTEAMYGVHAEDWLEETNEAMAIGRRLGKKVVVIGLSNGATLGVWAAAHRVPMAGLVLLSPNFAPKDWRASLLLLPWGDRIAQLANHGSRFREWQPQNALQAAAWTPKQPVEILITMMSVVRYINDLDFSQIQAPVLCLYTEADNTVSVEKIKERFRDFGSAHKELVNVVGAKRHVLAGDAFSPETNEEVTKRITDFVAEVAK